MKTKAVSAVAAGWFIPGLGHVVAGKYKRAGVFFACITTMAVMGLIMGGKIYSLQAENPLTLLAFFSDLGYGALYLFSKLFSFGTGDLKRVTFEFGTTYIAGAGLLNYLVALDAFDIVIGKKS
jgi:hypothetical protein